MALVGEDFKKPEEEDEPLIAGDRPETPEKEEEAGAHTSHIFVSSRLRRMSPVVPEPTEVL